MREADFDVIVIGAGHAGVEAAILAARAGATVGLLTTALESIGQMSCNPAIGGIAKSTLVREVDALGGVMARATDLSSIQFRMLNRSKGPAVWAPRSQCDRAAYRASIRTLIEQHSAIHTVQATVSALILDGRHVRGVKTIEGRSFEARCVVVTTGTFLRGRIHIGTDRRIAAGRAGERPTVELAEQLEGAGLEVGRFKTGTPPRIDGRSVRFDLLERQISEIDDFDYSWSAFWETSRRHQGAIRHPSQLPCWITFLETPGKDIIQDNLKRSAMYGGAIGSRGPRYCPSVEDKVVKFVNATRHQLFLEPEGHGTSELYVNGLSTSLPASVQLDVLRTVRGLENVRMTRAGYAIEYDFFQPTQLDSSLGVRAFDGLYFAGQINGTTGYEEAAAQGALAGLNAAHAALGRAPVRLGRETSYIGVLVDDLVTRGVDEPYRVFTSRSEFRLTVRQDNAHGRLSPLAVELGLLSDVERELVESRLGAEKEALTLSRSRSIEPEAANPVLTSVGSSLVTQPMRIAELARRNDVPLEALLRATGVGLHLSRDAVATADLELKYAGYFERERLAADKLRQMGEFPLEGVLDYGSMRSLSHEAREKLSARRPLTVAEAAAIPGLGPSDLQNLIIEVERRRRVAAGPQE
ncbi:MAG: tRNA uridine-5-carboxymethylaminomethyl(34) synthesis enzyme MnmG [Gemmatimonadota bacterium]